MLPNFLSYKTSMVVLDLASIDDSTEDEFVPDHRSGFRPSEVVQSKFLKLLPNAPVPVSCMHVVRDTRRASPKTALSHAHQPRVL